MRWVSELGVPGVSLRRLAVLVDGLQSAFESQSQGELTDNRQQYILGV